MRDPWAEYSHSNSPTADDTYIQLRCKQYSQTRGQQPITVHCIFPFYSANAFVRNEHRQQRIEWYANSERRIITHWMSKRDFTQISSFHCFHTKSKGWRRWCFVINVNLLHAEFGLEFRGNIFNFLLLFRWKPLFNLN